MAIASFGAFSPAPAASSFDKPAKTDRSDKPAKADDGAAKAAAAKAAAEAAEAAKPKAKAKAEDNDDEPPKGFKPEVASQALANLLSTFTAV
jgi:hypothetical protein